MTRTPLDRDDRGSRLRRLPRGSRVVDKRHPWRAVRGHCKVNDQARFGAACLFRAALSCAAYPSLLENMRAHATFV